ncbi:MAG: glycoside hydrolase family 36 N-terminal domain-containing protein, partial [Gammaproteobacteria bacterium]
MPKLPPFLRLDSPALGLVLDLRRAASELAWIGVPLAPDADLASLCDSGRRGPHESQPDEPPPRSLLPLGLDGATGEPALQLVRGDRALTPRLELQQAVAAGDAFRLDFLDAAAGIELTIHWELLPGAMLRARMRLANHSAEPLTVLALASLALPLPARLRRVHRYAGRWSAEMHEYVSVLQPGAMVVESRGGRPGFGGGNWLRLEEESTTDASGLVLGVHLAVTLAYFLVVW